MLRDWRLVRFLAILGVIAVFGAYRWLAPPRSSAPASGESAPVEDRRRADSYTDVAIEEAFEARRSGVWVESSGVVDRLLADDRDGSRHQRFIVRLRGGRTLLFAHNIDLAPRAPIAPGRSIRFRGMYEWSERGGTVHWTHHDPDERHEGGWLEIDGRTYR
jgi:hypothetical protein